MSTAERISVAIALTATIGFGIWAFVSDQPSTLTYVLSAPAGIVLIGWFRRRDVVLLCVLAGLGIGALNEIAVRALTERARGRIADFQH